MKNTIDKLVTLPIQTAKGLLLLAAQKGTQTKPFMEKILIDYEGKANHKKSANYKSLNPKSKKKAKDIWAGEAEANSKIEK